MITALRPPSRVAWYARWHAIKVLQWRDMRSLFFSPGPFLALAVGAGAALLIVSDNLDAISSNHILILTDAFSAPFFASATIAMFFLALSSVASVARERDQGTIEVLFYGPVDHASYLLGKHLAQLVAYVAMIVTFSGLFLAYSGMTGLRLGPEFALEVILSVFTAAAVAAFGLLLSTLTRGVRSAYALFLAITVLFLAIHFGSQLLSGVPLANNFSPLLFVRDLTIWLDAIVSVVSPFAVLESGVDAVVRRSFAEYLGMLALSTAHCVILLALAIHFLQRKGVRR
jgi:ABC-type transport system involved in multi-copper enzyme maturation permease subunit